MKDKRVLFYNTISQGHTRWIYDVGHNAIVSLDDTYHKCNDFETSFFNKNVLYGKIYAYKDKIIGVPNFAEQILIYKGRDKVSYIDLPDELKRFKVKYGYFWNAELESNILYIIGYCIPFIVVVDLEKEDIISVIDLSAYYLEERIQYYSESTIYNNYIIIPEFEDNAVIIFDKISLQSKRIIIKNTGKGFSALVKDNQYIWLFPSHAGEIVKWNFDTNEVMLYEKYPKKVNLKQNDLSFGHAIDIGNEILVFPYNLKTVVSISKRNGKMKSLISFEKCFNNENFGIAYVEKNDDIVTCISYSKEVIQYDIKEDEIVKYCLEVSLKDYEKYLLKMLKKGYIVINEKEVSLQRYLENILLEKL